MRKLKVSLSASYCGDPGDAVTPVDELVAGCDVVFTSQRERLPEIVERLMAVRQSEAVAGGLPPAKTHIPEVIVIATTGLCDVSYREQLLPMLAGIARLLDRKPVDSEDCVEWVTLGDLLRLHGVERVVADWVRG